MATNMRGECLIMATNTKGRSNSPGKNARGLTRLLTIIGWIAFAVGVVTIILNIQPFNDNNAGLMMGIGCVVGSIFIYFIGKSIGSMQVRNEEGKESINDD